MSKQTDYRAIVERIPVILHSSVTDVDLLTVTVRAIKDRIKKLEQQHQMAHERNATTPQRHNAK
ncbi:hypothetical protein SMZ34_003087 [Cronobacter sakazakii]|nr:hypothetical protein [Cronobacter sakazakii]